MNKQSFTSILSCDLGDRLVAYKVKKVFFDYFFYESLDTMPSSIVSMTNSAVCGICFQQQTTHQRVHVVGYHAGPCSNARD